jgi:hypothetical protein
MTGGPTRNCTANRQPIIQYSELRRRPRRPGQGAHHPCWLFVVVTTCSAGRSASEGNRPPFTSRKTRASTGPVSISDREPQSTHPPRPQSGHPRIGGRGPWLTPSWSIEHRSKPIRRVYRPKMSRGTGRRRTLRNEVKFASSYEVKASQSSAADRWTRPSGPGGLGAHLQALHSLAIRGTAWLFGSTSLRRSCFSASP